MGHVVILDPSIPGAGASSAPNAGDEIIAAAVLREVRSIFPTGEVVRFTTHSQPSGQDISEMASADHIIVGGSNLLGNVVRSRRVPTRTWRQWDMSAGQARVIERAVLLGVGWRVYEGRISWSTRRLYRAALAEHAVHSVRDGYTALKVNELGVGSAINTGCPTLWPFVNRPAEWIPEHRSTSVLTTVTDYRRYPEMDKALLELLFRMYDHVFFWPQGEGDAEYVRELGARVSAISPGVPSLDAFLDSTDCDYVGTRLHGGIHCLNARKRSLVISVDNRAAELGPETGVPTVVRGDLTSVQQWIESPSATQITLNVDSINRWRKQFAL